MNLRPHIFKKHVVDHRIAPRLSSELHFRFGRERCKHSGVMFERKKNPFSTCMRDTLFLILFPDVSGQLTTKSPFPDFIRLLFRQILFRLRE